MYLHSHTQHREEIQSTSEENREKYTEKRHNTCTLKANRIYESNVKLVRKVFGRQCNCELRLIQRVKLKLKIMIYTANKTGPNNNGKNMK